MPRRVFSRGVISCAVEFGARGLRRNGSELPGRRSVKSLGLESSEAQHRFDNLRHEIIKDARDEFICGILNFRSDAVFGTP